MITVTGPQDIPYTCAVPSDHEWEQYRAVVNDDAHAKAHADRTQEALEQLVRDLRARNVPWSEMSRELGLKISHLRWLETAYLRRQDRQREQ